MCFIVSYETAVQIKNCSKSTVIKVATTMKNMGNFCYKRQPSCAIAESALFAVIKDEWDTKEDTAKLVRS